MLTTTDHALDSSACKGSPATSLAAPSPSLPTPLAPGISNGVEHQPVPAREAADRPDGTRTAEDGQPLAPDAGIMSLTVYYIPLGSPAAASSLECTKICLRCYVAKAGHAVLVQDILSRLREAITAGRSDCDFRLHYAQVPASLAERAEADDGAAEEMVASLSRRSARRSRSLEALPSGLPSVLDVQDQTVAAWLENSGQGLVCMAEVWPPCRPPPPLFRLAGGRQSAHLAPDSLAQLAALPLKNPLRQQNYNKLWLENWGKPNLRLAGQIPFIPFDPLQRATPVLVRREYLSLSAVLDAEMEGLGKGWASVVVYGSPGVGKSTFLSYKANELMEAQRPFVFASAAASHAYLFCDIGVIEIPTELMDIDFLATTAVLVDSEAGSSAGVATGLLHAPRTFVVLAASPKNSSYRTLTKEGANFWTMQHWDKAEVSAVVELRRLMKQGDLDATQHSCLALRASFASSSLPRLEVADASSSSSAQSTYTELQLFGLLGPVAHPLFLYWPNDPDFSDEQNLSLAATKPLAVNSQSLITALHGQGVDDDLQRSDFHRVFLIEPRRPGTFSVYQPDYRLVIPTPLLRAYVRRSLSLYRRAERLTVLSAMLTQPTLKGFAFEAHALDHLVAATPPLSVTVVTVNGHTPYPLPAKPVSFNWDPSEDALPPTLKAPTLLIFPPLFGAFDALIYSPDGPLFFLQVTTSSTHQMKPARLRKIFNALPELAERELICVFVTNTQTSAVALVSKEYSALRGTSYAKEMTEEAAGGAEADRSTRSAKRVKRADFPDFQMGYLVLEESAVLNSLREAKLLLTRSKMRSALLSSRPS